MATVRPRPSLATGPQFGSDWPIVDDGPIGGMLAKAMQDAGLSRDEQEAVAAGSCRRLLGLA